jgi:non-specific protein-tyrosine kinase
MSGLLEELARRYEMVLLDTPSFLAVTDAAAIASRADGVVLVVGRAQARQGSVRAASQQLLEVGAHPLGVVVNRAEEDGMLDYYQRIVA